MGLFDKVAFPKHSKNVFNLSHMRLTTAQFGKLIPILCEEAIPGDIFENQTQLFVRTLPMLAPLMHRVDIYTHFFFVPNRLVWDNWESFITGGVDGTEQPTFPRIRFAGNQRGSLADFLGCGVNNENGFEVSALPFRAYQLIYNEYYRDQNLQDEIEIPKGDNSEYYNAIPQVVALRERNWEKDYFTSALPWAQRGPESVIPLGDSADIYLKDSNLVRQKIVKATGGQSQGGFLTQGQQDEFESEDLQGVKDEVLLDPNGSMYADLSEATPVSINSLRRAIALQRWFETNARGGSRYIEQIFSHFGVKSSDARLQRPEYLGGSKQPLQISEVLQTSQSSNESPLGTMGGHAISAATTKTFRKYIEEHGFIIGIMSIMPKSAYGNGTRRFFHKFDRFDYAWPEFANLGEQEVWNSEIYQANNSNGQDSGVFGYQSRYAEYKYIPNTVHGSMRDDSFSPWSLFRFFDNVPALSSQFVKVSNDDDFLGRIFPIPDADEQFIVQIYHDFKSVRTLPKHVIPSL